MMGRDIYFQIGNDKGESKRKAMVIDHQVNRRGQVQALVKVIETAGSDLGDEYKIGVSGGRHSIRGAIKDEYAQAHTLEQLATVRLRGIETVISEASKRVSIFDRETGSKPKMLRSGSLRADLNLIV